MCDEYNNMSKEKAMLIDTNTKISIVLPEEPTPREVFAAKELQKYLKCIINCYVKIASPADILEEVLILIGGPEKNSVTKKYMNFEEFNSLVRGPEGMLIKSLDEKVLLLAGSSRHPGEHERGTIYAVYEFLERFCGCCFAAYSHPDADAGEIVGKIDRLNLKDIFYCKPASDRPYRTAIVQYGNKAVQPIHKLNIPFIDWLAKNRYNRVLLWANVYESYKKNGLLPEFECRGIEFTVGHHEASHLFLPAEGNEYFPEHYYETHPEYYKLLEDGSRYKIIDEGGQLVFCNRNEGAIKQISENIIEWLNQNPIVDTIAMWPNDYRSEYCFCEECRKYSKVENYSYLVNELAKRVTKVHPRIKFDMLLYTDLWDYSEKIQLESCVMIDEATWHSSGLRTVGREDGSCLNGTHFEENLLEWRKTGAQVVYYDYYMGIYSCRQRIIPMADELQSMWKNFVEKDISGSGTQIECFNLWNHLLNFYCFARTGYDTSFSLKNHLERFGRLFGSGREYIEKILIILEQCLDGQVSIKECSNYVMDHIDKELIYNYFDMALEKAENARYRNNIRLLRMAFRYSDLDLQEPLSAGAYCHVMQGYVDENGEFAKMNEFDSFWKNDPGYGIMIPTNSVKEPIQGDIWYEFEKECKDLC